MVKVTKTKPVEGRELGAEAWEPYASNSLDFILF
uniref:Uncharacterized protein n=1 Tax=viral metagenome TaxID=1070528 RepID=A0A6C0J052_9ZZZZ